jgi:putative N6-adenine-specific DNA methylase
MAVCTPGLEKILEKELISLGGLSDVTAVRGGVEFRGVLDLIYSTNLYLATANRILLRIASFPADSSPALYNRANRIAWEHFVGFARSIRFRASTKKSRLYHKGKIVDIVAAAARDRLLTLGLAPAISDESNANLEFLVRFEHDYCTVSFNTSGENLHKRGWRTKTAVAPIRETIAASVLKQFSIEDFGLILDPFCGGGTFLVEGARLLMRYPTGADRGFAFMHAPYYHPHKYQRMRQAGLGYVEGDANCSLAGVDISESAINLAIANAAAANVGSHISFSVGDALLLPYSELPHSSRPSLLVTNLPYGKRLAGRSSVRNLVQRFVSEINRQCKGWEVAIICANIEDLAQLNLQHRTTQTFSNGGIKVSLVTGRVIFGADEMNKN